MSIHDREARHYSFGPPEALDVFLGDETHPAHLSSDRLIVDFIGYTQTLRVDESWGYVNELYMEDNFVDALYEYTMPQIRQFIAINLRKIKRAEKCIAHWAQSDRTDEHARDHLDFNVAKKSFCKWKIDLAMRTLAEWAQHTEGANKEKDA